MWTLVLIALAGPGVYVPPTIAIVPGFQTDLACAIAGRRLDDSIPKLQWVCVDMRAP